MIVRYMSRYCADVRVGVWLASAGTGGPDAPADAGAARDTDAVVDADPATLTNLGRVCGAAVAPRVLFGSVAELEEAMAWAVVIVCAAAGGSKPGTEPAMGHHLFRIA